MKSENGMPAWREGLLDRLRHVVALAWVFAGLTTVLWARSHGLWVQGVLMLVALPALDIVLSKKNLPFSVRAWAVIGSMVALMLHSYVVVGFNPGPSLLGAMCLFTTALVLGRRHADWLFAFFLAVLAGLTTAVWSNWWAGPPAAGLCAQ